MSIRIGKPEINVAFRGWQTIEFGFSTLEVKDVLSDILNYIESDSVNSGYRQWLKSGIQSIKVEEGYPSAIPYHGIFHTGSRLSFELPPMANVVQGKLKIGESNLDASDVAMLTWYILTNTNIDFDEDPRLDFLKKVAPDLSIELDRLPEGKILSGFTADSDINPFFMITFFIPILFVPFLKSQFPQYDPQIMYGTFLLLALAATWHVFVQRPQKSPWSSSISTIKGGHFKRGWQVTIEFTQQSVDSLDNIANEIFNGMDMFGFRWHGFKVEGNRIIGLIASDKNIVVQKWGYLYPQLVKLNESEKKNVDDSDLGPYISQAICRSIPENASLNTKFFLSRLDVYKIRKDFTFGREDLGTKSLIKEFKKVDWGYCVDEEKLSEIRNGSFATQDGENIFNGLIENPISRTYFMRRFS